jgi:hypothetical protein
MSKLSTALIFVAVFVGIVLFAVANLLFSDRLIEVANRGLAEGERFELMDNWTPAKQYRFYKRLYQVWRERRTSD